MESNTDKDLPRFQQLQLAMTQHIRNPERDYDVEEIGGNPIEDRRLKVYESLFFNNIEQFFSQIFPVCRSLFSEAQWYLLVREYLKKHTAETPLFHKLGLEFLKFIQQQQQDDWLTNLLAPMQVECFFQLAHYEWVELELSLVEKKEPVVGLQAKAHKPSLQQGSTLNNEAKTYRLAADVWPLYYGFAVQKIQSPLTHQEPVETFLLAQRVKQGERLVIDFHELSMGMYALLMSFQEAEWQLSTLMNLSYEMAIKPKSVLLHSVIEELSEAFSMPQQEVSVWLDQAIPQMLSQGWLVEVENQVME